MDKMLEIGIKQMKHLSPQSIAAYDSLVKSGKLTDDQTRVYKAIKEAGERGVSCKELANTWGVGSNEISGRFTELKRDFDCIRQVDRRQGAGVYVISEPFNDGVSRNIRGYMADYVARRDESAELEVDGGLPF